LGKCISCADSIFSDLYKCPLCGISLHGLKVGEEHEACGQWIIQGNNRLRVCEICANPYEEVKL